MLKFPNSRLSIKKDLFTLFFKVLFMNQEKDYLQDLTDIRSMMERSTRFISLSGLSGVFVGIVALIGAGIAHWKVKQFFYEVDTSYVDQSYSSDYNNLFINLTIIALSVLIIALLGGWYFTARKAKKQGQKIWTKASRQLLTNLFIPLVAGGVFCIAMYYHRLVGLIAPGMLIFYGLALVNSSKYTLNDIRYLGLLEITLGLIALFFYGYGLYFWVIGFGVLHILYGISMYYKYDRKK